MSKMHLVSYIVNGRRYSAFVQFKDGKPVLEGALANQILGWVPRGTTIGIG